MLLDLILSYKAQTTKLKTKKEVTIMTTSSSSYHMVGMDGVEPSDNPIRLWFIRPALYTDELHPDIYQLILDLAGFKGV